MSWLHRCPLILQLSIEWVELKHFLLCDNNILMLLKLINDDDDDKNALLVYWSKYCVYHKPLLWHVLDSTVCSCHDSNDPEVSGGHVGHNGWIEEHEFLRFHVINDHTDHTSLPYILNNTHTQLSNGVNILFQDRHTISILGTGGRDCIAIEWSLSRAYQSNSSSNPSNSKN